MDSKAAIRRGLEGDKSGLVMTIFMVAGDLVRECITDVISGTNMSNFDLVMLNPVLDRKVFRVHMTCSTGWFLLHICHVQCTGVIFV
jgi:hypothetical protein